MFNALMPALDIISTVVLAYNVILGVPTAFSNDILSLQYRRIQGRETIRYFQRGTSGLTMLMRKL
jgi:hypothetical protein